MANYKVGTNCSLTGKKCNHLDCGLCPIYDREVVKRGHL